MKSYQRIDSSPLICIVNNLLLKFREPNGVVNEIYDSFRRSGNQIIRTSQANTKEKFRQNCIKSSRDRGIYLLDFIQMLYVSYMYDMTLGLLVCDNMIFNMAQHLVDASPPQKIDRFPSNSSNPKKKIPIY
jgi:hypothetical protein